MDAIIKQIYTLLNDKVLSFYNQHFKGLTYIKVFHENNNIIIEGNRIKSHLDLIDIIKKKEEIINYISDIIKKDGIIIKSINLTVTNQVIFNLNLDKINTYNYYFNILHQDLLYQLIISLIENKTSLQDLYFISTNYFNIKELNYNLLYNYMCSSKPNFKFIKDFYTLPKDLFEASYNYYISSNNKSIIYQVPLLEIYDYDILEKHRKYDDHDHHNDNLRFNIINLSYDKYSLTYKSTITLDNIKHSDDVNNLLESTFEFIEINSNIDIVNNTSKYIKDIKIGDLVYIGIPGMDYRNDHKLIYNGKKLETLDDSLDEYGNLPNKYTLNLFGNGYFDNTINHNNIRWLKINNHKDIIKIENDNRYEETGLFFIINNNKKELKIYIPKDWEEYNTSQKLFEHIETQEWYINNNRFISLENANAFLWELESGGGNGDNKIKNWILWPHVAYEDRSLNPTSSDDE